MRIGIDARELSGQPTGVGRYLANLLAAWSALPEARAHAFILYQPVGAAPGSFVPSADRLRVTQRPVPGGTGSWWEQVRLPVALLRNPPDVLFAPGYTAPLATVVPIVVTIHDVSFLANPAWFTLRERLRRRVLTRLSAHRARLVLTVSQFSRDEIVRRLGVSRDRVHVIAHGGTPPHPPQRSPGRPDVQTPPAEVSGRGREPLVLFVGSIFNRRRVPDLIRAFALVARERPDLRLEIVGDNRTHPREDLHAMAAAAGVAGRVGIRAYVTDEVLADLYARAAVFAFLSEYEGFGLTPLEALGNGVPPLVLDTAVAREVYGDAAVYVPPGNLAATADALRALLFDQDLRRSVLGQAQGVLGRYSWERAGRDTLAAIERAARPAGPAPPRSPRASD
jgi:glycosyltransferase involved in cell wall biosynthesis